MYPIQSNASSIWCWEFSCLAAGSGCGTRLQAGVYEIRQDAAGFYAICPACGKKNYVPVGRQTPLFFEQFAKKV
jgi:hypothetical protein